MRLFTSTVILAAVLLLLAILAPIEVDADAAAAVESTHVSQHKRQERGRSTSTSTSRRDRVNNPSGGEPKPESPAAAAAAASKPNQNKQQQQQQQQQHLQQILHGQQRQTAAASAQDTSRTSPTTSTKDRSSRPTTDADADAEDSSHLPLDPTDPRFRAVAAEIDRRILKSLEDIVAGLQLSREALKGLQQQQQQQQQQQDTGLRPYTHNRKAKDAERLQTTIAQALHKVEGALYGDHINNMKQKIGGGTAVVGSSAGQYAYSHPPKDEDAIMADAESSWVAVSTNILANSTRTSLTGRTAKYT